MTKNNLRNRLRYMRARRLECKLERQLRKLGATWQIKFNVNWYDY